MLCDKMNGIFSCKKLDGNLQIPYLVDERNVEKARIEIEPPGYLRIIQPPDSVDPIYILQNHKNWIRRKINHIEKKIEETNINKRTLENKILFFGDVYNFFQNKGPKGVKLSAEKIIVQAKETKVSLNLLEKWLRRELKSKISPLLKQYTKSLQVNFEKLYIRKQKTKWGSCSSKNNISFNLKTAALPQRLLNYLVFHEVAHLKQSDHTEEYWKLIQQEFPDYEDIRSLLEGYWFLIHRSNIWRKILA